MGTLTKTEAIWMDGAFVPWEEAKIHVMAHSLHYGSGVFEGIRSYKTERGTAVFRLDAHLRRLFQSASLYEMEIPFTIEQLTQATLELVRRNKLENGYLRPLAIFEAHSLHVSPKGCPVSVIIAVLPMGAYLNSDSVRVTISPVRRFNASAIPANGKSCGQYVNSVRAVQDAFRRGFDEAILLNEKREVAEGSGENLFLVKNGALVTNDEDAAILMGITRDSVLQIARDLGIPIRIRGIRPEELARAEELFFTGTAAEVTAIGDVDGTRIGNGRPGPITERIRARFFEIVRGQRAEYHHWLAFAQEKIPAV